nr:3C protein [Crohivirus A]
APFLNEFGHIFNRLAYIEDAANPIIVHVLPLWENKVLVYSHSQFILSKMEKPHLVYKGFKVPIESAEFKRITISEGPMDVAIISIEKLPFIFKSIRSLVSSDLGSDTMILWNSPRGFLAYPVSNAHHSGSIETLEGDMTVRTITYVGQTVRGMCGGVLVSKVGGAYKINGLHIAGTGIMGMAASISFINAMPSSQ